ncbi:UNVERIFIED_CONTAM: hypothetical protein RMT77_002733 [Armadillidium vulgare]
MRLTLALFKPKKPHLGPGRYVKQGKRRVNVVAGWDVHHARKNLEIEEENMLYLRHPYLTLQQSFGHAAAYGKHKEFVAQKYLERMMEQKKKRDDVHLEERFSCLRRRDKWD